MKKLLRDWLGMTEEKTRLEVEVLLLKQRLDQLADRVDELQGDYVDIDDRVDGMYNELEEKPTHKEVEEAIRNLAYCEIDYVKRDLGIVAYEIDLKSSEK